MDRELLPPDVDPEIKACIDLRESQEHEMISKRAAGWSYARIAKHFGLSDAVVERKFREEHIAKEVKIAADAVREAVVNRFAMLGRKAAATLEEIMEDDSQPGKVRVEAAKEIRTGIVALSEKADRAAPKEGEAPSTAIQVNLFGEMSPEDIPDSRNVIAVADSLRKKRHS